MKEYNFTANRKYTLFDFVRFGFLFQPVYAFLLVLLQIIQAVLPSLQVFITADFVDTAIAVLRGQQPRNDIYVYLLTLLGVQLYSYTSNFIKDTVTIRFRQAAERRIRTAVVKKRASLKYRYIEDNDTWELMQRIGNDPTTPFITNFMGMIGWLSTPITIVSSLTAIATQVWWMVPYLVVLSIPFMILSFKRGKTLYEERKELQKIWRRTNYYSSTIIDKGCAEERGLFSFAKRLLDKWEALFHKGINENFKLTLKLQNRGHFIAIGTSIVTLSATLLLCLPLGSGAITLGMFISMNGLLGQAFNVLGSSVPNLFLDQGSYQGFLKDYHDFCALEDEEGALEIPDHTDTPAFETLEFRNVCFTYPGTEKQILKDFCMTIRQGRHYAIVGQNGAGKTTVTKLLLGLYEPDSGEILLNGKPLHDYPYAKRKALFSAVFQDFGSYALSFAENIKMGDLSRDDDEDMKHIVQQLDMTKLVEKLPQGYDTELGTIMPDSVNISGGEWQRLAIARCVYHHAPLQILDEPTASLDPVAESRIYQMFGEISRGTATIFITHRLGAAKLSDEVLVIDDGHVVECGSHRELMRKHGKYYEMFEAQRSWYQ